MKNIRDRQKEYINLYQNQGWEITPVEFQGKNPILGKRWNEKILTKEEINKHFFNGRNHNIGIILGKPSGDLEDTDLDCDEARKVAHKFLPLNTCRFGRASAPDSHFLYISEIETQKFSKVLSEEEKKKKEKSIIIEIRSTGGQTVFPGSIHESGEEIFWTPGYSPEEIKPQRIDPQYLSKQVGKIASVALLSKYWYEGVRQELSLCLASILLRAGWDREDVEIFFEAICIASHDDDYDQRLTAIDSTIKQLKEGDKITGLPRLQEITDRSCVDLLKKWLKLCLKDKGVENKGNFPPLVGYSLRDLMGEEFPPVKYFVQDILPEGFTILAGKPKIGKSILSKNILLSIATGCTALGRFTTEKTAVAYFALEDTKRRLKNRLIPMLNHCAEKTMPNNFTFFNSLLPLKNGGLEQINAYLTLHPEVKFIVIDTIGRVKSPILKGNSYEIDTELYSQIHQIYLKSNVSVMVITHTKKNESVDFLDNVTGSAGGTGVADTVWVLTKNRTEKEALLKVTGRDIETEQELALELDGDSLSWKVLGEGEVYKLSKERQEIVDLMKRRNGEMKVTDIAELLGKERSNINKMLLSMEDSGIVIKLAKGLYILRPKSSNIFINNSHVTPDSHVNHITHNGHIDQQDKDNVTM